MHQFEKPSKDFFATFAPLREITQREMMHYQPPQADNGKREFLYIAVNHLSNIMEQYGTPPKNWLVESILVTLFCCLPFGIVGIVNAANVNARWTAGDFEGAERASAEAKKWTKIGFFVGIVVIVVYFILAFTMGIGAIWMNTE